MIAAGAVRAYQSQELCLYKGADGKIVRRPTNGDDLAQMLARFAVTGSFNPPERAALHEAEMMQKELARLMALRIPKAPRARWTFEGALEYLAGIFGWSPGTVHSPKRLERLRAEVAQINAAIAALKNGRTKLK